MTTRGKIIAAFFPAFLACLPLRVRAGELPSWGRVDAMTQALNTQMCLSCNYDGNSRGGEVEAVTAGGAWGSPKKKEPVAQNQIRKSLGKFTFKLKSMVAPPKPEYGPLKDREPEKKPDVNQWNNAIEGANGAAYFGILGMILGGPVGLLIGAAVGFLLMYYGRIHNEPRL
jgi:hypothetical protein